MDLRALARRLFVAVVVIPFVAAFVVIAFLFGGAADIPNFVDALKDA